MCGNSPYSSVGPNGGNGDNPVVIEDARRSDSELRPVLSRLLEMDAGHSRSGRCEPWREGEFLRILPELKRHVRVADNTPGTKRLVRRQPLWALIIHNVSAVDRARHQC